MEIPEVPPNDLGADLCQFCGTHKHGVNFLGQNSVRIVFVLAQPEGDRNFFETPEGELLKRILDAMKLGRDEVGLFLQRDRSDSPDWEECVPYLFQRLKQIGPAVVIALGESAQEFVLGRGEKGQSVRGMVRSRFGIKVIGTEGLQGMINHPALKKAAWDDLKLAIRELGLE
jgi:uracil-DNA glycosylase family 4